MFNYPKNDGIDLGVVRGIGDVDLLRHAYHGVMVGSSGVSC